MIYTSDDYLVKYQDTLSYLIGRAVNEGYSFPYIEKTISYSKPFSDLEKSNVTLIAFTSYEKLYNSIFPSELTNDYVFSPYDVYGWLGYMYIHLFLKLQITFELLFMVLPIEEASKCYKIYHEMDINQMVTYFQNKIQYNYFDLILKNKGLSTTDVAVSTNISFSTLNALRYNHRDVNKLEANSFIVLAYFLKVKPESLLSKLPLNIDI